MSRALISSSFENRVFLNRSRIINLLANNSKIDNLDNEVFILLSLNIKNATINNNNLIFKISDYDAIIWNDRQLNGENKFVIKI